VNFIQAMTFAMRDARITGMPAKVIRDGAGGWKIVFNGMPRGPWEQFWSAMSRTACHDTCAAIFMEQFWPLVEAGNKSAKAAKPEVEAAMSSGFDTSRTFFNKSETQFMQPWPHGTDADDPPY